MLGQEPRGGLPDLGNTERIDKFLERDGAAPLDGGEQVLCRLLPPTFPAFQRVVAACITVGKGEDIGWVLDQALVEEGLQALLAQAFDVERIA